MRRQWDLPSKQTVLENPWVRLAVPHLPTDLGPLFEAASLQANGEDLFRYHVNIPPMVSLEAFEDYLQTRLNSPQEVVYAVFSKRLDRLVGCASLMNLRPEHGVAEVGSIWYTKAAQKTEINSNTMLLLFGLVFEELGYRRLEWKCNDLNLDSRRAAIRLGFTFEGTFRQHMVSRGENRDTAWFALLDSEWSDAKQRLMARMTEGQGLRP